MNRKLPTTDTEKSIQELYSENPNLVTIQKAAKALRVSKDTLRRWEAKGKISSIRTTSGYRLYDLKTLSKAIKSKSSPETSKAETVSKTIIPAFNPQTPLMPEVRTSSHSFYEFANLNPQIVQLPSQQSQIKPDPVKNFFVKNGFSHTPPVGSSLKQGLSFYIITFLLLITLLTTLSAAFAYISAINQSSPSQFITRLIKNISNDAKPSQEIALTNSKPEVLAASSIAKEGKFLQLNLDTNIVGNLAVEGEGVFTENITAPNILYSLNPGTNITITGDPQNPTISTSLALEDATTTTKGIASFSSTFFTVTAGAVSLADGSITGDQIDDGTISNSNLENTSITINAGSGLSGGGTVALGGSVTLTATGGSSSGVTSITGTSNQVVASGSTGAITLSLPQDIATTSSPTFASLLLTGSTSGTLTLDTAATTTSYTLTLPADDGTNGYVLQTDGSGNTSWVAQSGGVSSLQGAYDGGNTITTTTGRNLGLTLASGLATSTSFALTNAGTASAFVLNDTNGATNTSIEIQSGGSSTLTITEAGTLSTSGNISTTSSGTITSAGTLTASNGFTMTTGALSLTSTSGAISSTGLTGLTYTLSSGTAAITAPTLNLNTSSTGNTAIGNATGTVSITSSGLNVTTGGTITGATWNGTAIGTQYGGTGQNFSATAQGSLPYFSAAGTMSALAPSTSGYVLTTQGAGANPTWTDAGSLTLRWNTIDDPAGNQTLAMADYTTTWNWATADAETAFTATANALTTGTLFSLSSTSTAGGNAGTTYLLDVARSGINANASHTAYGVRSQVSNSGTTSTNIAAYFSATNASNNYALIVPEASGNVGIGTSAPTVKLEVADGNDGAGAQIYAKDGGVIVMAQNGAYPFQLGNNTSSANSVRFRIDVNGAIDYTNAASTPTVTLLSSSSNFNVLTGNFKVGNGTPGVTLDGEDAYIEGTLEVDGAVNLGTLSATSAVYTDGSSNLTTTAPTSGTIGYWSRSGTTLSPSTSGDNITTTGNISTTSTGTITSAGLLTGSAGLTVTGAAASLNASSNFATNINTGTSTGTVTVGGGSNAFVLNSTTADLDATGAFQINSSGGAISIGNDAVAQAINIGTGAAARTITVGNATGATALAFNSGTGSQTFTSAVTTGTTTTSGFVFNASSLTSGTALYVTSSATSGKTVDINATQTSGTIFNLAYGSAKTLSGDLTGLSIDLNSGNVDATNQNLTGVNFKIPTVTDTHTSGTKTLTGMLVNFGSGAGINQNGAGGTLEYIAGDFQLPALTQTAGTLNAYGTKVTTPATITTGGTAYGNYVSATGVGAGTLSGLGISSITGGAGTEYALNIGSGWDAVLRVGSTTVINGSGVTVEAGGGTGQSTYATGDILYASGANTLAKRAIGNSNEVLTVVGGVPTWSTITGASCTNCLVNNPTADQTISPTGQGTTGLSVRQTSTASPTDDIFQVTSSDGATKYFYVDKDGNVSTSSTAGQTLTLTPTTDTTALTLVGTNVSSASLQYINSKNASATTGILNMAYGAAQTLTGTVIGFRQDLSTNVTATNQSVTGYQVTLPGVTNTITSGTKAYTGLSISGGSINQNGAGGTTNYIGADITVPALTQTAGTLGAYGVQVTTPSSITTGGTAYGYNVAATGVGAGSLYGLNISNITAGAGTEVGAQIGSGWDTNLLFNDTTTRVAVADGGTITILDSAGNSLCTITDSGSAGDLSCSGTISGSGSVGFWSRASTTISPATANDIVSIATTNTSGADLAITNTGAYTGTGIFNLTANSATTGTVANITANGLTTGNAASISSTSTAGGASGSSYLLNLSRSGTNAQLAHTAYGISSTVTNTNATSGTNIAGYFSASGATTANYGLLVANGNVGIGDTTPSSLLEVGNGTDSLQISSVGDMTFVDANDGASITGPAGGALTVTAAATALALQSDGSVDVTIAGGSGATGCTVANSTGNLTCSGNITGSSSGTVGFWSRSSTTLSPATANDIVSIATTNTSGADLAITNTGAYTGTGIFNLTANSATTGNLASITGTGLTTGEVLNIDATYAPTDGSTNEAIDINLTNAPTGSANILRGLDISIGDATTLANTTVSGYFSQSVTGAISTGTRTQYGIHSAPANTATNTGGQINIFGIVSNPSYIASGDTTGSRVDTAGLVVSTTNTLNTGGTAVQYGVYVGSGTSSTTGSSTKFGVYLEPQAGADNNYGICFDCDGTWTSSTVAAGIQFGLDANAVTLYRSASDTLKTDDNLEVGGTTGVYLSGTGGDLIFANAESISNDTDGTLNLRIQGTSGLNVSATGITSIGNVAHTIVDSSGALAIDSNSTGAINIGTGANAKTITVGNATGATALAFTSGTGSQTFTSSVATTSTTSSAFVFTANSLTSGTGAYINSTSLTTGKLFQLSTGSANTLTSGTLADIRTTSTALTGSAGTGSLLNLDWTPGSSTTATGDLFALNIGSNGTTTGNLFNILDSSSSIFSVSETSFTTSLPSNFTSAGDISAAYDLNFTNPTASYIKSQAPLSVVAGETFGSSNLTLGTYNQGTIVFSTNNTTTTAMDLTNTTLTTGTLFNIASTNSSATSGTLLNIAQSGVTTGQTGATVAISTTSTTNSSARALTVTANSMTTGIATLITTNALTSGHALSVASSSTGNLSQGLVRFNASGAHSGTAFQLLSGAATGGAMSIATNSITTGTALTISSSTTGFSSGGMLSITKTGASGTTAFTGDIANIAYSHTFSGGTVSHTGNVLDMSRTLVNQAAVTHTVSGALMTISDSLTTNTSGSASFTYSGDTVSITRAATRTAGTITNSGNILTLTSSDASHTGASLSIASSQTAPTTGVAVITANSATTGDILSISGTALTTGSALVLTGPTSTGVTDNFVKVSSDIGADTILANFSPDFNHATGTGYGLAVNATDSTTNTTDNHALFSSLSITGNAARTNQNAVRALISSTSTSADTLSGVYVTTSVTGAIGSGTRNVYGVRSEPTVSNATSASSTTNVYGLYSKASGNITSTGAINSYGLYVANGSYDAGGTNTAYGIYLESITGGDTGHSIYSAGGNNTFIGRVGVGVQPSNYNLQVEASVADYLASFINSNNTTTATVMNVRGGDNTSGTFMDFRRNDNTAVGSITFSGGNTTAYNTTSDRRLKTDIADTQYGLSDLLNINVNDFRFISDPSHTTHTGFMAQDLYNIYPEAVTVPTSEDRYWQVDYGKVTPLIVKSVQELNYKVENALLTINPNGQANSITTSKVTVSGDVTVGGIVKAADYSLNASDINRVGVLASLPVDQQNRASVTDTLNMLAAAANEQQSRINDLQAKEASTAAALADAKVLGEQALNQTASLQDSVASSSATIANLSTQIEELFASITGKSNPSEASPSDQLIDQPTDQLALTPPTVLFASDSATLDTLTVNSQATISGQLTAYQGVFQDSLKSLGETFLAKTNIAGDLSVDGTLTITEGSKVNALPILYLQTSPLAEAVDFFNGLVTITKDGELAAKEIVVDKITVKADSSAGQVLIPAGSTEIPVLNELIEDNSIVILTSETTGAPTLAVADKVAGAGFVVKTAQTFSQDIKFNYLIVGQK